MKVIYVTYYDHIERAGYMPELIVENWMSCDQRVICCAPGEVDRLTSTGIAASIVDIGISIKTPSDIPKASNATIDQCFRMGADWVVYLFGDLYMTPMCDVEVWKHVKSGTTGVIPSMGAQLYVQMYVHKGIFINSKAARLTHDETADGEGLLDNSVEVLTNDLSLLLDVGYLGLPQYYKHTRNHIHIWKPDGLKEAFLRNYEAGNLDKCCQLVYSSIRSWAGRPLQPIDLAHYGTLLNRMDLMTDYNYCMGVLKDVHK